MSKTVINEFLKMKNMNKSLNKNRDFSKEYELEIVKQTTFHKSYLEKIKLVNFAYAPVIKIEKNPSVLFIKEHKKTFNLRFIILLNGNLYTWDGNEANHDDIIMNFFMDEPIYIKGIFKNDQIAISTYVSKFEKVIDDKNLSENFLDELWNKCEKLFNSIYEGQYHLVENEGLKD